MGAHDNAALKKFDILPFGAWGFGLRARGYGLGKWVRIREVGLWFTDHGLRLTG